MNAARRILFLNPITLDLADRAFTTEICAIDHKRELRHLDDGAIRAKYPVL
jgi:hypothetical protein